ncbi:MAG TPA: PIG-L family deacetylase [Candidatus Anoxymicrobiaceae bacterium]
MRQIFGSGPGGKLSGRKAQVLVLVLIITLSTVLVLEGLDLLRRPVGRGRSGKVLIATAMGDRLLIIAPHPDDEGLAAGGLIEQAEAEGRKVEVVIMTSGDGNRGAARACSRKDSPTPADFRAMGRTRVRESREATKHLGLPARDLLFLAYPDGSLNSLWDHNWDYDKLHLGLNGARHAPYGFAYQKRAPYCGENLVRNLESVIKSFGPDSILFPDAEDDHHDHWAANAFVQYALTQTGYRTHEVTYLVHRRDFPEPRGFAPDASMIPPPALEESSTGWQFAPLSQREERVKGEALKKYTVPMLVSGPFIESFIRKDELTRTVLPGRVWTIGKAKPDLAAEPMPYVVNSDPPSDVVRPDAGPGTEITRVAFARGAAVSYLGLEIPGGLSDSVTYTCRLRIFKGPRVSRADIAVRGVTAAYMRSARNSVYPAGAVHVVRLASRVWIELPSSLFAGKNTVMMSVDSIERGHRTDRTSWQRYQL